MIWIFVQLIIYVVLTILSFICSKSTYWLVLIFAVLFTLVEVFVPWLMIIQLVIILAAGEQGLERIKKRGR